MQYKANWRKYPYKTRLIDYLGRDIDYCIIRRRSRVYKPRVNLIERQGSRNSYYYSSIRNLDKGLLAVF